MCVYIYICIRVHELYVFFVHKDSYVYIIVLNDIFFVIFTKF